MNARRVSAASGVIFAAQKTHQTAAGIAASLEAAGLLQSPESAAKHAQLQDDITGACLARYEEEQENNLLRARVAELEAARTTAAADRDKQIIAWLEKKAAEYGTSNRENRAKAEAVDRMADKLSRGAVRPACPPVSPEDPHDSPLHRTYETGHDLPPLPGACEACGDRDAQWCPDCGACRKGCFGGHDGNDCTHANAPWSVSP